MLHFLISGTKMILVQYLAYNLKSELSFITSMHNVVVESSPPNAALENHHCTHKDRTFY
jgi:hypothetical protein